MKKYTIEQSAQLLANKTHSVYSDINDFETLRKILKLAFPKDQSTENYNLNEYNYYGYSTIFLEKWSDVGRHLENLTIIHLSSIIEETKKEIETVTISKEDYDRFLKLEKKDKKSDQKFLDKCAIGVMNGILSSYYGAGDVYSIIKNDPNKIAEFSFRLTKEMIKERNKQQNESSNN